MCLLLFYKKGEKVKIEEILIDSKEYPEKLKNIYDSPQKLYVLGNKNLLYRKVPEMLHNTAKK